MNETTKQFAPRMDAKSVEETKQGVEKAQRGNPGGVKQIDMAEKADPAGAEAAEQEASDGPEGLGLSR